MMNIQKCVKILEHKNADTLVLLNEANMHYLCGFSPSEGMIIVLKNGDAFHLVDSRYTETAENHAKKTGLKIIEFKASYYEELAKIIKLSANILETKIDDDALQELAKCSRGTPRIANRLMKRVLDYADYENMEVINLNIAKKALKLMDIDELGLDAVDRNVLETAIKKFNGGPVGLDTLSAATGEDATTIEDVVEPFLIQLGFIARTPRGRTVLPLAYEHLGFEYIEK